MSEATAATPAPAAEPTAAEQFAAAGLSTAPFDARFPNQRQTKSCWQNFIDYHRCVKAKGEDYAPCDFFWRNWNSLCPSAWSDKWNDQIEEGNFPGMNKLSSCAQVQCNDFPTVYIMFNCLIARFVFIMITIIMIIIVLKSLS